MKMPNTRKRKTVADKKENMHELSYLMHQTTCINNCTNIKKTKRKTMTKVNMSILSFYSRIALEVHYHLQLTSFDPLVTALHLQHFLTIQSKPHMHLASQVHVAKIIGVKLIHYEEIIIPIKPQRIGYYLPSYTTNRKKIKIKTQYQKQKSTKILD